MEGADPLVVLRAGVDSYGPYLRADGELTDPVFGEPTQYATPYHAFCQAVLGALGPAAERAARLGCAARGLRAALRHAGDPSLPATFAAFRRETAAASRGSHRDFFWPPILRGYRLLRELGHPGAADLAPGIAAVDVAACFRSRPPSNWAAVWMSGEWLRMREGLSRTPPATFDAWLGEFFAGSLLVEQGLYQEPGHPNSYDLFTRHHLAELLAEGYAGAWRGALERLLETGLRRSLGVQLSDGSLASAHRSAGQTWTLGCQCAFFATAARLLRSRDPEGAAQARAAAARALAGLARWQRPGGPFSPVENLLPPPWRVGYEPYTADAHYASLALAFLAAALRGGAEPAAEGPPWWAEAPDGERPACVFIEGDPTFRALCHHGPYSVHVNAWPAPDYDGFGIVDVTFGPGRLLHLVSSVRHLGAPGFFNLGLALRSGPGPSEVRPVAQQPMAPLGPIAAGPGPAALRLEARARGAAWAYRLEVAAAPDGVRVAEATPGRRGPLSLLVPYLRDCGSGERTTVRVERFPGGGTAVRLALGHEALRLILEAEVERAIDLPYGFENRRGLCGLLRLDVAGEPDLLRQRLSVEA